ncbi:PAS domain-containing protein [Pedobacter steynii]
MPQWVYDFKTLKILQVNDAAIRLYGYSRKEFMEMDLIDLRPKEDEDALIHLLNNQILKGHFDSSVVRHVKKNGEIIYVKVDGNSVFLIRKMHAWLWPLIRRNKLRPNWNWQKVNSGLRPLYRMART